MAKRFTDTTIWERAWFRQLSPKMKTTWRFLLDRCDHAGIWQIDMDLMAFYIGESVTLEEILESFGDRVSPLGDKIFIPAFVEFQYGELNPANRVHASAIAILKKQGAYKALASPMQGAKDKDKDKDKEKDMDKVMDKEKEKEKDKDNVRRLANIIDRISKPIPS